jgi:hypothetical protein
MKEHSVLRCIARLVSSAAACAVLAAMPATASENHPARIDPAVIDELAEELLLSLQGPRTIAVRPFREGEIPVSVRISRMINDALVAAISKHQFNKHTFVTRDHLQAIYLEGNVFKGREIGQLLKEASADVQLIGNISPDKDGLQIYYQAFELNGRQVASTDTHFMRLDLLAAAAVVLDAGILEAVDHLAGEVKDDLKTIQVKGIYHQTSGVQTLFGRYVADKFVEKLRARIRDLQTMHVWVPITGLRNIDLEKASVEQAAAEREGAYVLSGVIWDFGEQVEIGFTLKGTGDNVATRSTRILKSSIPDALLPLVPLEPEPATTRTAEPPIPDNLGQTMVYLASDRGEDPLYRLGDMLQLVVQVSKTSYLYCFSHQADGSIVKIFPNRYHTDNRISAHSRVMIPNEKMPFKFRLNPPAGVERVKCLAVDRDVTGRLPRDIATKDFEGLPFHSLDEVIGVFQSLPGLGISHTSLTITVGE